MKKKILLISIVLLTLSIICVVTTNMSKNKNNIRENVYEETKNNVKNNFLTLMLETEENSGIYEKSTTSTWPGEGYVFNSELSRCENGGELSWDESTNTVKLLSNKSDSCYVYFDIFTETPRTFAQMIENGEITINTNTVDFTIAVPRVISYKDTVSRTGIYELSNTRNNYYFTYSDSYIFNEDTGKYDLENPIEGIYKDIYEDLNGKYIMDYTGSSSSALNYTNNLWNVYFVNSAEYNGSTQTGTINYTVYGGADNELNPNDSGLFIGEDDLGKIYYFRGNIKNNYVKFGKYPDNYPDKYFGYRYESSNLDQAKEYNSLEACKQASNYNYNCTIKSFAGEDIYWRIIRTNGDGSIRLLYDGTQPYEIKENPENRIIGYSVFYDEYIKDNTFAGYMYGTIGATSYSATHANLYDTNIKKYLDNWYNTVINSNNEYSNKISDAIYCNDRSVIKGTGIGSTATTYAASFRRTNNEPSLKCSQVNDRFTVNSNINNVPTNGKLTYPIGLLTSDEVAFAGETNSAMFNNNYYLNDGIGSITMTPSSFSSYIGIYLSDYNALTYSHLWSSVKPVISLKSDTLFLGDGTMENPFTIAN